MNSGMCAFSIATLCFAVANCASGASFVITRLNLPVEFGNATEASGINDSNLIVGWGGNSLPSFQSFGFLYHDGNIRQILPPRTISTTVTGINNDGQIIGSFFDQNDGYHNFVYSGGKFAVIDLSRLPGAAFLGINDSGQIVGHSTAATGASTGFLYQHGVVTTISVPGATSTQARGINDKGQIVGEYTDASFVEHGFLDSGGVFTTIDVPGAAGTVANGINDKGQIVGYGFFDTGAGISKGFLDNTGHFTLIYDSSSFHGTDLSGINDSGRMVGVNQGFHGLSTAILVTSVPERGNTVLLGLLLLMGVRVSAVLRIWVPLRKNSMVRTVPGRLL